MSSFFIFMTFNESIKRNQTAFGYELAEETVLRLEAYYKLVEKWNPRLHLVAPCTAEEFAIRHVLESLSIIDYLSENAHLTDVGTGAGLPSIPCLIVRADLKAALIESNTKKAVFLREAAAILNIHSRVSIFNQRFEQTPSPEDIVTSRALDKFTEKLPEIVSWSQGAKKFLFFGGEKVRDKLTELNLDFAAKLIPLSDRRFVFIAEPETNRAKTS